MIYFSHHNCFNFGWQITAHWPWETRVQISKERANLLREWLYVTRLHIWAYCGFCVEGNNSVCAIFHCLLRFFSTSSNIFFQLQLILNIWWRREFKWVFTQFSRLVPENNGKHLLTCTYLEANIMEFHL